MRFNPKSDISTGRVDDAGSAGGGSRLPIPSTAGGGRMGLLVLVVGFLVKYLASRRSMRVQAR